jgi:hypothetical protein
MMRIGNDVMSVTLDSGVTIFRRLVVAVRNSGSQAITE